jgi:succinate dehydrogenase / fumarate reductase, membrane anchor subunit
MRLRFSVRPPYGLPRRWSDRQRGTEAIMTETKFVTPAKAARGLGSAKSGTEAHIRQRVSAIALIFLVPWFIYSMLHAGQAGYDGARDWAGKPWNALLLILISGAAFYHMRLGLQAVIEDYISKTGMRSALLILNTGVVVVLFVTMVGAVLKIWIDAVV